MSNPMITDEQLSKLKNVMHARQSTQSTDLLKSMTEDLKAVDAKMTHPNDLAEHLVNNFIKTIKNASKDIISGIAAGMLMEHSIRSLANGNQDSGPYLVKGKLDVAPDHIAEELNLSGLNSFVPIIESVFDILKSEGAENMSRVVKMSKQDFIAAITRLEVPDATTEERIHDKIKEAGYVIKSFEGEINDMTIAWMFAIAAVCTNSDQFLQVLVYKLSHTEMISEFTDQYNALDLVYALDEAMLDSTSSKIYSDEFDHDNSDAIAALGFDTGSKVKKVKDLIADLVTKIHVDLQEERLKRSQLVEDILTNYTDDPKVLAYALVGVIGRDNSGRGMTSDLSRAIEGLAKKIKDKLDNE